MAFLVSSTLCYEVQAPGHFLSAGWLPGLCVLGERHMLASVPRADTLGRQIEMCVPAAILVIYGDRSACHSTA